MFNLFNKGCCQPMNQGCMEREIVEPTINKCIEKEFYHDSLRHTHIVEHKRILEDPRGVLQLHQL